MKVKCRLCSFYEDGYCTGKSSGGKAPSVLPNKFRKCSSFEPSVEAFSREADRMEEASKIPVYAPTWRYYADSKELKESGEEKGARFIRINPHV